MGLSALLAGMTTLFNYHGHIVQVSHGVAVFLGFLGAAIIIWLLGRA